MIYDLAVIIPTVLRLALGRAVRSVFINKGPARKFPNNRCYPLRQEFLGGPTTDVALS